MNQHVLNQHVSNQRTQRRFPFELFVLTAIVYGVGVFISRALPKLDNPGLIASAVTCDLVLLVPALYYWLAVRRQGWPAFSTIPVFVASLFAASRIVPAEYQSLLRSLHLLVPIAEALLLLFVAAAVTRALRHTKTTATSAQKTEADVLETARTVVARITGNRRAAEAVAYELGLFSYAFTLRRPQKETPGAFTYHRRTALNAITGAFLLILAAEAVPVHLLLSRWSPTAAWIVLALTLYSFLWLVGDARAMSRRPIRTDPDALRLRFGLRWGLEIPWSNIESIKSSPRPLALAAQGKNKESLELVPLGASPTHRLELRVPAHATGPYGFKKSVRAITLFVDDPDRFDAACRQMASK